MSAFSSVTTWALKNINHYFFPPPDPNRIGVLYRWEDVKDEKGKSWCVALINQGDGRLYSAAYNNETKAEIPVALGNLPIFLDSQLTVAEKVERIKIYTLPSISQNAVWFLYDRNPTPQREPQDPTPIGILQRWDINEAGRNSTPWTVVLLHEADGYLYTAARSLSGATIPLHKVENVLTPAGLSIADTANLMKASAFPMVLPSISKVRFCDRFTVYQSIAANSQQQLRWKLSLQILPGQNRVWVKAIKMRDYLPHHPICPAPFSFPLATAIEATTNKTTGTVLLVTENEITSIYIPFVDEKNQIFLGDFVVVLELLGEDNENCLVLIFAKKKEESLILTKFDGSQKSYFILGELEFPEELSFAEKIEWVKHCSYAYENEQSEWVITPKKYSSLMDPQQKVSYHQFALTLLDGGTSSVSSHQITLSHQISRTACRIFGHASLLIEGLKNPIDPNSDQATDDKRFALHLDVCDENGYAWTRLKSYPYPSQRLTELVQEINRKSATILISRSKFEKIWQKYQGLRKNGPAFTVLGRPGFLSPEYAGNCTSIPIEFYLELGVQLPQSSLIDRPWASCIIGAFAQGMGVNTGDPRMENGFTVGPVTPDLYTHGVRAPIGDLALKAVLSAPFFLAGLTARAVGAFIQGANQGLTNELQK